MRSMIWGELVREVPDYQPARKNLKFLGNPAQVARWRDGGRRPPSPGGRRQSNRRRTETTLANIRNRTNS